MQMTPPSSLKVARGFPNLRKRGLKAFTFTSMRAGSYLVLLLAYDRVNVVLIV